MMIDDLFDSNLMDDDILDDDLEEFLDINESFINVEALSDDSTSVDGSDDITANPDGAYDPSFLGAKYTDAEIDRLRSDVSNAEYEMKCREHDVSEWESKVSLNNTKEKIANGDYAAAVSRLNEAKSRYNAARAAYDRAKSRLNNAL